nr:hypothetical protein Iba_chr01aCG13370 [Ipomoea batatas]GMC50036.1 hypothetical protein Iba_chr01bCG13260 [Ipomoea batatas]
MFVPDLGELAYCKGDAVMVSNEVVPDGPGEAAVLPMSCAPEGYSKAPWPLVVLDVSGGVFFRYIPTKSLKAWCPSLTVRISAK